MISITYCVCHNDFQYSEIQRTPDPIDRDLSNARLDSFLFLFKYLASHDRYVVRISITWLFNQVAMTVLNLLEFRKLLRKFVSIHNEEQHYMMHIAHAIIVHHFLLSMAHNEWFPRFIPSLVGGNFWIKSWIKWKPQNEKINNTVYACHSQIHVRATKSELIPPLAQWMKENKQLLCKPHSLATNITSLDVKNNTSSKLPIIYYYTIRICCGILKCTV